MFRRLGDSTLRADGGVFIDVDREGRGSSPVKGIELSIGTYQRRFIIHDLCYSQFMLTYELLKLKGVECKLLLHCEYNLSKDVNHHTMPLQCIVFSS